VILSKQIPWQQVEQEYSTNFSQSDTGNPAKSARIALGSLIIKERLDITDRETVLQIAENPYLQYFLGFSEYKDEVPFDHSLAASCIALPPEFNCLWDNDLSLIQDIGKDKPNYSIINKGI
jgi:hypothetical protein